MGKKQHKFSIIFKELNRLSEEPELRLAPDELKEYEEIQSLREIVLEVQSPEQTYFTST